MVPTRGEKVIAMPKLPVNCFMKTEKVTTADNEEKLSTGRLGCAQGVKLLIFTPVDVYVSKIEQHQQEWL